MKKKFIINFLKFLLFLGFGLAILYLVYHKQDVAFQEDCVIKGIAPENCSLIQKVIQDFKDANYFWVLAMILAFIISNINRTYRWGMLLEVLGYRTRKINNFLAIFIGYFANLGLPRMGEVVRGGVLAQYEKLNVEKVIGTIAVSRMIDLFFMMLITMFSLVVAFNKIWPFFSNIFNSKTEDSGSSFVIYLFVFLLISGILLFWFFRKYFFESAIGKKVITILNGFVEGFGTIRKVKNPAALIFHSASIWVMYFLMVYLCFFAYFPTSHLSPVAALVVFVFGAWGMLVPSPGGMGTYHFMAQTALSLYGVSGEDGFSFANIAFFSIQLGCIVLVGILSLILLPIINRNYKPSSVSNEESRPNVG